MKHRSDIPNGSSPEIAGLVGSFRTFGEYGVLYEVIGIEQGAPEMAQIVVVETGEKTRYPVQQLMGDPVVH